MRMLAMSMSTSIERDRTFAGFRGIRHRTDDAARLGHLRFGRREDAVGELDLRGMDRPFAFIAEHRGAFRRRDEAIRIVKIPERPIDGAQTIGTASHQHARLRRMPLIGPIIGAVAGLVLVREHAIIRIDTANDRGARACRRGIVSDPEGHRFEPLA